jgi:hypothetical protein
MSKLLESERRQDLFCKALRSDIVGDGQVPVEGKMQLVDPESALRYRRGFLRHSTLPTDTSMLPFELVPPHPEAAYIGLRSAWKGVR